MLSRCTMGKNSENTKWYTAGLYFECCQCGGCCSGPGEGYIWVTRREVELIADFLEMSLSDLRRRYLRRVGMRTSIIEDQRTRDCIFLHRSDGQRKCVIYKVRPNQCRNWPFWPENLKTQNAWNEAVQKCPGMNRGRQYTFDEIEHIKKEKQWWKSKAGKAGSSSE